MEGQNQGLPDLSAMLSGILSNPQALSAISSLLGSINKPQAEAKEAFIPTPKSASLPEENMAKDIPAISGGASAPAYALPFPIHPSNDKRKTLLLALKPFLSKSKCDTVDLFIRMLDLISLIERVK
ncbi:MAG: hypothetical protein IIW20_00285 [Clostridia bacterium]|nr:hypothetical protein [Clostridia bacterium]